MQTEAPLSEPPAISIQGVTKSYQTKQGPLRAIEQLDVDIKDGEFIAILGPSGCGKSTLLKMTAGLERITSGQISVRGSAVKAPRPDVSVVFQSPVLFPWRTVMDNVLLPIDVQRRDRTKGTEAAKSLLKLVGLADFEERYPAELSGGMQQRVSIARALVTDPQLLLMDEPFGALDAMTRDFMNVELQRIWLERRKTVILITHSIPEAVYLADRVLVMSPRPGKIIDDIVVSFPRPRPIDITSSDTFSHLVTRIRTLFDQAGTHA